MMAAEKKVEGRGQEVASQETQTERAEPKHQIERRYSIDEIAAAMSEIAKSNGYVTKDKLEETFSHMSSINAKLEYVLTRIPEFENANKQLTALLQKVPERSLDINQVHNVVHHLLNSVLDEKIGGIYDFVESIVGDEEKELSRRVDIRLDLYGAKIDKVDAMIDRFDAFLKESRKLAEAYDRIAALETEVKDLKTQNDDIMRRK